MSWVDELANLTKRIFQLSGRVEKNAEQITQLNERLDALVGFTKKVASAVKDQKRDIADCKKDIGAFQERNQSAREKLVLQLDNELLRLEARLNGRKSSSFQVIEGGQKLLPEDGTEEQG